MPRHPLPLVLFGAPLVLLGLAGCGSSSATPTVTVTVTAGSGGGASGESPAPSVTAASRVTAACGLLTLKEAEAVVGTGLTEGVEGNPTDPSCSYEPDPKAARTAQVRVITGDGAKKTYDIDHDALDHPFKDVPGVGDEAHQEDSAIFFRSGSTWAGITVVTLDDPRTVVRPLQDAAKVIISRLP